MIIRMNQEETVEISLSELISHSIKELTKVTREAQNHVVDRDVEAYELKELIKNSYQLADSVFSIAEKNQALLTPDQLYKIDDAYSACRFMYTASNRCPGEVDLFQFIQDYSMSDSDEQI